MSEEIVRTARVRRIVTGHGSSDLGIEVLLEGWFGDTVLPNLKEGEELEVVIRRKS